jgi:hypothetical protein
LPYEYVIEAIVNSRKIRHQELHEQEIPIAQLVAQQAEVNRDAKKRKRPFAIDEFYIYPMDGEKDSISGKYGAAAKELISSGRFPRWGLFIYKELMENADKGKVPEHLCLIGENAIILAPEFNDTGCNGMLIALEGASNRTISMTDDKQKVYRVRMPEIKTKVVANENCYFDILA